MGTKKDNENKRELAKMLYVGGSEVAEIAERVGVSRQSVSAWINKNGWKELRAARSITRPELVNKLLVTINNLIEDVNTGDDPTSVSGLADKLVKLSSVIERLDKKANIVQTVDVFMAFSDWVEYQAKSDPEVTVAFMKVLNRLHNEFLLERANVKE
ncbi:terminase [Tannerella sp. oral taxon BU063 isolate Cell 5]|jgi:transposase|uniref:Terminase n=1 Tax=Tannerella sp. oral taxon BU063 isolate Cell 5 TaxID=1410950 RepID=W2CCB8_9BACT|nr:terminase [Tannerella sp. oral taxon BU063 isolate Cell 5]RKW64718.1 MAG: terminase [Tannerella sp.]DAL07648.1 MAG TPA: Putative ATPase subunit of terminase (gpP like) [Caudoviricetes sp.]DAR99266.1 MAG TPA: Putative ATPase subunit of terminase (gpP like) [Caudoviricetes sp.]